MAADETQDHSQAGRGRKVDTSPLTLIVDRAMGYVITGGGVAIIAAVLAIFVFIVWQVIPLFRSAHVEEVATRTLPTGDYRILGVDDAGSMPFLVDGEGRISVIDLSGESPPRAVDPGLEVAGRITATHYSVADRRLALGNDHGQIAIVEMNYSAAFVDGKSVVSPDFRAQPWLRVGVEGASCIDVGYAESDRGILAACIQQRGEDFEIHAVRFVRKRSLLGAGKTELDQTYDLTSLVQGKPVRLLIASDGETILVATAESSIYYLHRDASGFRLRQSFKPFEDKPDEHIQAMEFSLGDVSLIVADRAGDNRVFSLFVPEGGSQRLFGRTKDLEPISGTTAFVVPSRLNKTFLLASDQVLSVRYLTTESVRWEEEVDYKPWLGCFSEKGDQFVVLDQQSTLRRYALDDPYPEAGLSTYFGKLWYEGYTEPAYVWQSSSGSNESEPKLSMIPLIFGTLKGTLYAMLFAVPIALAAALYASQFAHPKVRAVVKPTMEIMASLPSVVLGFLGALVIAPLLETRIPSILCMVILVPVTAMLAGVVAPRLPAAVRARMHMGGDILFMAALLIGAVFLSLFLGPLVERVLFVATDPSTGHAIADFRYWWPQFAAKHPLLFSGTDFQQKSSLVVGFMMGFAVIPIVFTISEDSLSNVPGNLRSGSLALGASRWQTAVRVVLPTASAGIFSALMVGLGRAVGETMIVLMATGNTPIMDFNIFSGFRSLSANLATELPEASQGGTLFRSLFLGAMLLFLMTFVVNTTAEVLRQHLRRRYRTA